MTPIELYRSGNRVGFAMPYIDGNSQYVSYDGRWFYIGASDTLDTFCSGTSGYIEFYQYLCALTGKNLGSNPSHVIYNGRGNGVYVDPAIVGTDLYNEQTRAFGSRCYWMSGPDGDYHVAADGTKFPRAEFSRTYGRCVHDGLYYPVNELIDGMHYLNLLRYYVRCEMNGGLLRKDNDATTYKMAHGAYWSRLAFLRWGRTDPDGRHYSTIHTPEPLAEAA